jgi:hypothetical protein
LCLIRTRAFFSSFLSPIVSTMQPPVSISILMPVDAPLTPLTPSWSPNVYSPSLTSFYLSLTLLDGSLPRRRTSSFRSSFSNFAWAISLCTHLQDKVLNFAPAFPSANGRRFPSYLRMIYPKSTPQLITTPRFLSCSASRLPILPAVL